MNENVMSEQVLTFNEMMKKSLDNLWEQLPGIIFALVVGIIGFLIIRLLRKWAYRIIDSYSKSQLVSEFIVNIFSLIVSIFLVIICLSIVGWGEITTTILTGAGISTFVVGFALKDIGENFLSGILMAFSRPFRVGDLIEFQGLKGKVIKLSLRETTIKSLDGRDVYIPNGMIIKNPLQNYTIDNHLRNDFTVKLAYNEENDIKSALAIIEEVVLSFNQVQRTPPPTVYIDQISGGSVSIEVLYWLTINELRTTGLKLKSELILKVSQVLIEKGYTLS